MTGPLGLMEQAERIGGYHWVERRAYEVLGGWTGDVADRGIKAMLDRHAQHHAWRAGQWWERLPVLAQVDRARLTDHPSDPARTAFDVLASTTGVVARLAGAYRVALPRIAGCYRRHLRGAEPVAGGPVIRTLTMALADVEADWHEGETRLQELIVAPAQAYAAAYTAARLESVLSGRPIPPVGLP